MNIQGNIVFCNKKIIELEYSTNSKCNTETGTKLFQKACKIQLDYFRMLNKELNYTLFEGDI